MHSTFALAELGGSRIQIFFEHARKVLLAGKPAEQSDFANGDIGLFEHIFGDRKPQLQNIAGKINSAAAFEQMRKS